MPVKIGSFEPLSEAELTELRQQKVRKTDSAMLALLAEVETGRPVRVPLVEGGTPVASALPSAGPPPAAA